MPSKAGEEQKGSLLNWLLICAFGGPLNLLICGVIALLISALLSPVGAGLPSAQATTHELHSFLLGAEFWSEVIRDFGIAMLVAMAVATAIERIAAQERDASIKERVGFVENNALNALFKTALPGFWLNYLKDLLQDKKFIRRGMNITYEIRRPSAEEEKASSEKFCIYTSTFRYTVYNHDSSDENYDVRVLIEKAWADELNKFTKILYLIVDKENVSGPQVEQADAAAPDLRFQVRYSHPIQVPAGGFREVEVCFQSVCYPRDTTTWTCVDPADSLDLTLKAPPEFRLYSILKHPKESKGEGWQVRPGEFRVATKLPCLPSTVVELAWFDPSSPLVNPGENVGGGKVAA